MFTLRQPISRNAGAGIEIPSPISERARVDSETGPLASNRPACGGILERVDRVGRRYTGLVSFLDARGADADTREPLLPGGVLGEFRGRLTTQDDGPGTQPRRRPLVLST
jgi:hypothetical protein